MKKLTCQEVIEQVGSYLEAELREELVVQVEQHMVSCEHCRAEVDTLRGVIRIYQCEQQVVVPVPISEKLRKALEAAYEQGPERSEPEDA